MSDIPLRRAARGLLAKGGRLRRLVVFGFEQIVLSRLLEAHRPLAEKATAALLKTKDIDLHSPELGVAQASGPVEHWSHGFSAVNAALFLNLRNPDTLCGTRYARPAPAFQAIYLWDSAFIAQVWKWWDTQVASDILSSVIRSCDGPRLQHFFSEFAQSSYTQPPLIAWSLQRLAGATSKRRHAGWVAEAYPALRAYHAWLVANRRLPNGLYAWAHAYESGVENAPRFGDREERRLRDTTRIGAPDFCAYMALDCEALAAMARTLGRDEEAEAFALEADELRAAVNATLWDEEEGLYFDRDADSGRFIRCRTIASLLPLWAGIPDEERAERLIAHIVDPGGFNTLIPLPSVAIGDPSFERDMWRGPVWLNVAFAVVEGLRRYGRDEIASDFAFRLCDGVYRTFEHTGRFYEFYDPTAYGIADLERKRGNRWKAMTLGRKPVADFVGWTGLVNTLVTETLFGLGVDNGTRVMRPRFPARAQGRRFALKLPLWDLEIDLTALAGGAVEGEVRSKDSVRAFAARFGEAVMLDQLVPALSGARS